MKKTFDLQTIEVDNVVVSFFYKREKNDIYGNPRYRVYIMSSNTPTVIETIAKTYDICDWVHSFIKYSW